MDLLCSERISPDNRFAETDRVVFGDVRVLNNLLDSECGYVPRVDYFEQVQSDIKPFMRKMVTTWMLEVCEEQRCEDQVAAASLVAAVRGLHLSTGEELAWQVGAAVGADRPSLERMVAFVESLLSSEMSSLQHRGPALASKPPPAPSGGKLMAAESDHKPETPTDVQDIHF